MKLVPSPAGDIRGYLLKDRHLGPDSLLESMGTGPFLVKGRGEGHSKPHTHTLSLGQQGLVPKPWSPPGGKYKREFLTPISGNLIQAKSS